MTAIRTGVERLAQAWVGGTQLKLIFPLKAAETRVPVPSQGAFLTSSEWEILCGLHTQVLEPLLDGVKILGLYPVLDEPLYIEGQDMDFVVYPLEKDPLYQKLGRRYPIPRRELEKLKDLRRRGLHFPSIYIAEEVPKHMADRMKTMSPEHVTIPLPRDTLALAEKIDKSVAAVGSGLQLAIPAAFGAVFTLGALFLTAGVALASAAGSCPIILGAFTRSGQRQAGELACYCLLSAWEW